MIERAADVISNIAKQQWGFCKGNFSKPSYTNGAIGWSFLSLGRAGVDGLVAVGEDGETARTFLSGGIHGFEMNLEPEFLVRFDGFCETRVICCETLFPPVFSKFFFAGH
jgi:hypothetical protein